MARYTQLTWKKEHGNLMNLSVLSARDITGTKTIKEKIISPCCVDYDVEISLREDEEIKQKVLLVRVICEEAPYKARPDGIWGVDPYTVI